MTSTDDVRAHVPSDPFVGRSDGLATIAAAVAAASSGHGSLVLLAGEAGIGKTRLADQALRPRDDGRLVLWGSCSEGDGVPPFWPWTEAMKPLIGAMAMPPEIVALLPGLAPEGATAASGGRGRDPLPGLQPRRRSPRRRRAATARRASCSTTCTGRTRARSSCCEPWPAGRGTSHFVVVGTYRDTDVGLEHPLHRLLGELARAGPRVVLTGLGPEEVAQLLEASNRRVEADVAAAVAVRTGGNPFFVREIGRSGTGVDDLPPAVRDVLLHRIDLPPARGPSRPGGRRRSWVMSTPTWSPPCSDDDPLAVLDGVDELIHRRLLVRDATGVPTFAHALVRETVLAALPARRLVELHGRAADAIEARSGPAEVDAIAHHRVQSAPLDPAAAVRWAAEAGRAARRQLAYEQAVRWFERAVALVPPGTPRAGRAARRAGRCGRRAPRRASSGAGRRRRPPRTSPGASATSSSSLARRSRSAGPSSASSRRASPSPSRSRWPTRRCSLCRPSPRRSGPGSLPGSRPTSDTRPSTGGRSTARARPSRPRKRSATTTRWSRRSPR